MPQEGPSLILMKITEEGRDTHSDLQDFVITDSLVLNLRLIQFYDGLRKSDL